jgi:adenine-specific DNA-methyltransferase
VAAIEDLIKQIPDSDLRKQLASEIARLKATKKFGLIFEEHLPELVRLPGMTARVGARVLKKHDPHGAPYRVLADVNGKKIKIVPESGGLDETLECDRVVVIKAFGEPMFPALIPIDAIERSPGKRWHVLINAENYHAHQCCTVGQCKSRPLFPRNRTAAVERRGRHRQSRVAGHFCGARPANA